LAESTWGVVCFHPLKGRQNLITILVAWDNDQGWQFFIPKILNGAISIKLLLLEDFDEGL
jgi:hypothetical protein